MLKTVATLGANGALTYLGTWNASTNTPTLTSSVGLANNYYVVSVAGTTNLNGITNWQVGDWAIFNGSVWERIEGGASESFANLTVTGTGNIVNLVSGNVSLTGGIISNVTIVSGTANLNTATANVFIAAGNVAGNLSAGAFSYGTLSFVDVNIMASYAGNSNNYVQTIIQNLSNGTVASADLVLSNNLGTASGYYGDLGINSSTFTGNGSLNLPNAVYLYGENVPVVIGTANATAVHFLANSSATDAMVINANNTVTINTLNQGTSSNATFSTASLPLVPEGYIIINNNGTNVKIPYYAV
jgi:hypothetical protein